jgi:hypothetical protein
MPQPVVALAIGVFVAGAVQLIFQFPALRRLGLVPHLRFGFRDPGVKRIMPGDLNNITRKYFPSSEMKPARYPVTG